MSFFIFDLDCEMRNEKTKFWVSLMLCELHVNRLVSCLGGKQTLMLMTRLANFLHTMKRSLCIS